MKNIDLVEGDGEDFAAFVAWVARRAAHDHANGLPRPKPLGKTLCDTRLDGWRKMHVRLASTVYNQTRDSLLALDIERAEALNE